MKFAWFTLIPVFLSFILGSLFTYSKFLRDSSSFMPVIVGTSAFSASLWVLAVRRLQDTNSILLYSMLWDCLMVVAYYAGPMIFHSGKLNWQAWAAAAITIGGLFWFKQTIDNP